MFPCASDGLGGGSLGKSVLYSVVVSIETARAVWGCSLSMSEGTPSTSEDTVVQTFCNRIGSARNLNASVLALARVRDILTAEV